MRILVLHQNLFDRLGYERAIDHEAHDVTYAGAPEYLDNIPDRIRCEKFPWDPARDVAEQLRPLLAATPHQRVLARHEKLITPAAELRAEFDIPGQLPDTARNFRDKLAMKSAVAAAGLRVPRHLPADALPDTAPWPGRTVLKPRDGSGSQGVRVFDSYADAAAHLRAQDDPRAAARLELEEYVDGPIWHVDGFLFRGEPVIVQPSRYIGTPLGFERGEPVGTVQRDDPALADWAVRCVRALGGETLTFHLEAIETADGPVFLEAAARCGGGYIVRATELRTGAYLHTLDMASDVDDALAERFIGPARADLHHGFFLYPGHVHGSAPVTVRVADGLLDDPVLTGHRLAPPGTRCPSAPSYRPENLPLSGTVAHPDPDAAETWIRRLFARTTVHVHHPAAEAYDGTAAGPEDHELAHRLAEQAGELLLGLRTETALADPGSLKDLGDARSHAFLTAELARHRPQDAVLSEEGVADPARLDAHRVWIVDPLDGTREYAEAGRADWAVHVALWVDGRLAAGAVALPARGTTLSTARPHPAADPTARDLLGSRTRPPAFLARVAARVGSDLVGMGSAGAKSAAVLLGEARAYVHAGGQYEWDSAAPAAVALAAGYHVSRLDGSPMRYNQADPYLPDLLVCRTEDAPVLLAAIAVETAAETPAEDRP
ncbi:inositol monophosphatase family protein [Kitasatospora fiedleri]|uniref:inositol monophosphatase family protein n=1 Tax=Kitasatospora fiedleri TaxID=2991545 RepID=UPI00249C74EB|nr:inositol monophosphatase family protein [Kitasatospora fiedleri]